MTFVPHKILYTFVTNAEKKTLNLFYPYFILDINYILRGSGADYTIDCCGTITEWQLVANQAGTVYLQVWRPTTGNDYELLGENAEPVGKNFLYRPKSVYMF